MTSVLETLRDWWAEQEALWDLVPPERVHLGPPNPGAGLPCVGLVSEEVSDGMRTSTRRYPTIKVGLVAQANDIEALEALGEALREGLEGWQSERYGPLQVESLAWTIARREDSPSRVWSAEGTVSFTALTI